MTQLETAKSDEALKLFSETYDRNSTICGSAFMSLNGSQLEQACLRAEQAYGRFRDSISQFSKLPEVVGNVEELHFIAVIMQGYQRGYYTLRGIAQEIRERKKIHVAVCWNTLADLESQGKSLEMVLSKVFGHNLSQMLEES